MGIFDYLPHYTYDGYKFWEVDFSKESYAFEETLCGDHINFGTVFKIKWR